MPRIRITKRVVDGLKPATGEYFAWDSELPGFGVRVRPSGAKVYVFNYRAGTGRKAPKRRMTLGTTKKLAPEEARKLARKATGAVAHGTDPSGERKADRRSPTVAELVDVFIAEHAEAKRKRSTAANYKRVLRRFLVPKYGTTKASNLLRSDLARLHLEMRAVPYQANRLLAIVGSLYTFAGRRGLVPEGFNPARGIERYREDSRERFLKTVELERLGAALREAESTGLPWDVDESKPTAKHLAKPEKRRTVHSPFVTAAVRLLLFTGCRLREILHLKWAHIDFERGLLLLPDSKTGRKTIVLNAPALAVLATLPRVALYVIAGDAKDKPRADLTRPWHAITKHAGLEGLRIHDLRHSFASVGAGGGMGLPIVGKLLGHAHAATTARYAHVDADPLRRASERIGSTIAAAMGEGQTAEVIPMKPSAAG